MYMTNSVHHRRRGCGSLEFDTDSLENLGAAWTADSIRHMPLGSYFDGAGTHFSLHSPRARRVQICLLDPSSGFEAVRELHPGRHGIWRDYFPGVRPGQRYGFRVWQQSAVGSWQLDPRARAQSGGIGLREASIVVDEFSE